MRGRRILSLMLLVAASLTLAAAAQADRKPSAKERHQVAAVVELPPKCATVRVSTVTKKPKWASVAFKPGGPSECEPLASDGVTVAKKKSGHWRFVTAGSDFTCTDLYRDVPQTVVDDLGIRCR